MSRWPTVALGDVVTLHYGKPLDAAVRGGDGAIPVYGANGIKDYSRRSMCQGPSLVVGRKGSAGEINRADGPFWPLDVTFFSEHDKARTDLSYLEHLLRSLDLPSLAKGVKPGINRNDVYAIEVPLPPLEEQKRIVAVLDQAFAALGRARANAEISFQDARQLRSLSIEDLLSDPQLGELQSCGDHMELLTGFAFRSSGYTESQDDIRLVRGDNIVQGAFRWDGVKRWPASQKATYQKYELARDDVLVAMDRTWVSAGIKYAVVEDDALPSLLVQRVARLRAKPSIDARYLAAWIGSPMFERYVLSIQTGLGVPHVSGGQLESFPIRVPSLDLQSRVIDRLTQLSGSCEQLQAHYRRSIEDIDALRHSLLQAAFSGQLT